MKSALILVDIQNDFLPGGALPVDHGEEVVPIANKLMEHFDLVVASKDWHPANHGSFAANHPWRKPGQKIELAGLEQVLWPIHCVEESFGAEFAPGLKEKRIEKVFYKGTDPATDGYSAFFDNGRLRSTGLGDFLQEKCVEKVYIVGLAIDSCLKYTALDALGLGFETYVVTDGVRGVEQEEGDAVKALAEWSEKGVHLIRSEEVPDFRKEKG